MTKKIYIIFCALALICTGCGGEKVSNAISVDAAPEIFPDYTGVTVPVNIAPLNFGSADDAAELIDVVIRSPKGTEIHCQSSDCIDIDEGDWSDILAESAGGALNVTVSVKNGGKWSTYAPFDINVSTDSIDYGIAYRLIAPGYEKYSQMGIYERNLSNFDEKAVFENTQVEGCVNCHSFRQGDTRYMNLHVRGPHGATMLRTPECPMDVYSTATDSTLSACVYPYWHPEGRYIAYSTNSTRQIVHANPDKLIEVFDLASDVHIYDTASGRLLTPDVLRADSIWETFPAFSSDGRKLYYCAARAVTMPEGMKEIRYDICAVDFDPATGAVGAKVDTLVAASAEGKSAVMPRPSYDGRSLVYTLADYGTFPIWHDEADLWRLDLTTGETAPLTALNSDATESYHSWSTNSRWLVFGSRRGDGLHTVPYIAHIAADGTPGKPFMLPQRNPRSFYADRYRSFNIPEFIAAPVDLDSRTLAGKLNSTDRKQFSANKIQ